IAREDVPGDPRLVAYVIPSGPAGVDAAALREHLAQSLPEHMVPAYVVRLAQFPLTPNRKIDRKALPPPDASATRRSEHVAPGDGIQQRIAEVWERILGVGGIGADDNFFELGGHSLLAVQAHRELKSALERELT